MGRCLNFYLVRHAESANNSKGHHDEVGEKVVEPAAKRAKGLREPDPPLTEKGVAQAKAAAHVFQRIAEDPATSPELRPSQLYVSGFKRALQTCNPLATALDLKPKLALDTHEAGGVFLGSRKEQGRNGSDGSMTPLVHGLNVSEMQELLPGLACPEGFPDAGWWRGGYEAEADFTARAQRCTEWMWTMVADKGEEPGAVVCVTHGLFLDLWLKSLLGMPVAPKGASFLSANGAYWLLQLELADSSERHVTVLAANVVDHVPMAVRTGHAVGGRVHHTQPSFPHE